MLVYSRGGTGGAYIYTSELQEGGHGGARVQVARCGGVRPGDDDDDRSLPRERRTTGWADEGSASLPACLCLDSRTYTRQPLPAACARRGRSALVGRLKRSTTETWSAHGQGGSGSPPPPPQGWTSTPAPRCFVTAVQYIQSVFVSSAGLLLGPRDSKS